MIKIPIPAGYKPSSLDSRTKIKIVTDALVNTQGNAFAGMLILQRTKENNLDQLQRREIVWALEKIQKANRDLFMILPELSTWIKKDAEPDIWAEHLDEQIGPKWRELLEEGAIVLRLHDRFDNWCEAQRHRKSISIANLSVESREKVLATVRAIYQRFELSSDPNVTITFIPSSATENAEARRLSLEFLANKNVVRQCKYQSGGIHIDVEVDVKEFFRFRDELLALYAPTTDSEQGPAQDPATTSESSSFASMKDLKWQDITIRFLDGLTAKISVNDTSVIVDFRQIGFEDARTRLPNTQWHLLKLLAERAGQLSWEDSEASDNVKKKKQLLSDTLKAFFHINDDPFYPYREEKAYRTKFTLKAEGD